MTSVKDDIANPILYRTYWSIVCRDILYYLGYDATKENKLILHEFHKRILGYKTIAGRSQIAVEKFILEVIIFWQTEFGWFIRSSRKHEIGMENKPLSELWGKL
jgi:hypothetical protein